MTAQIIPISDSSLPLATSVGPNDLLLMDQVDGTQITGYKTKRLKSAFVGLGFANICAFGADLAGVADVATAFNAAVASLPATGGTVFFPAGIYNFATSVSNVIASNKSVRLMGAGPDASILSFASGIGMTFTYTDYTNSTHFKDLTFATRAAGTATALTLSQSGTTTAPGDAPNTIFDSVVFRGSDGYVLTNYWTTCVNLDKITCVSFVNCDFSGANPTSPAVYTITGTGVTFAGDSSHPPLQIVFTACEFNYIGKGVTCGAWFQGLMLSNCNFTGGDYGVNVLAGISGNDQLSAVNCQFNVLTVGIFEGTPIPNTMIKSCLFITTGGGSGIIFGVCANYIVDGCCFTGTSPSGNGVVIQAIAGNLGGIIKGNIFIGLSTGIWIQAAIAAYANIHGNWFSVNTSHITNAGSLCNIKDNLSYNPVGAAAITTSASPMTYTAGQSPETIYMSAGTGISAITQGAVSILPASIGANVNHTVQLEPNEAIIITYTGTLVMKKMVH